MTRRWFLSALATLGLAGPAVAQAPPPMPVAQAASVPVYQPGAAREPMPLMPGNNGPAQQQDPRVSRHNDGSATGFSDDCECGGMEIIVSIGGIGLLRQHLGNRQLGFLDPGININGTPLFADTGLRRPAGTPPGLNTHDVSPDMHLGGGGGRQARDGGFACEVAGC